ncbi:MAG: hypothetical protein ABEH77_04875 [Halobacteriaceae archaeon]
MGDLPDTRGAYAAVLVAVAAGTLLAGLAGAGPLAGAGGGNGEPRVNVSAAEDAAVGHFNDHRNAQYLSAFDRRERLDDVAAAATRARATEGAWPGAAALAASNPVDCEFGYGRGTLGVDAGGIERYATADGLARDVALTWIRSDAVDLRNPAYSALGIDIRVGPDGAVLVAVILC